jgi:hypothetical protein
MSLIETVDLHDVKEAGSIRRRLLEWICIPDRPGTK